MTNVARAGGRQAWRQSDDALEDAAKGGLHGSGPAKGVIELSARTKSSKLVQNYNGKGGVDFIFDHKTGRFAMGKHAQGHDGLADALRVGNRESSMVGGRLLRQEGKLVTNEWSGHYGHLWTDKIRTQFSAFMKNQGVDISGHTKW